MPTLYRKSKPENLYVTFVWDGNKDSIPVWFFRAAYSHQVIYNSTTRESTLEYSSFSRHRNNVRPGSVIVAKWNDELDDVWSGTAESFSQNAFETIYEEVE